MDSEDYIKLDKKYSPQYYHPLDVVLVKGEGVWVEDIEGKRYMDFLSGYSALSHGHRHKKIIAAAVDQMKKMTLTSRAFRNDQMGPFCEELCTLTGFDMFLPMNSGAEGVEAALKVARRWASRKRKIENGEIIVCKNNFHGRTITIISFSSYKQYKDGFGPLTPGFKIVDYNDVNAIKKAITKKTIGVLIEPIQGEGGVVAPDEGYLTKVAKLCREKKILFILDEIQTGFGRTGKMFAYEHEKGAKPDILIVGKALGGGLYPVSGILASKEIMSVLTIGDHGSTFGGNSLAAAIGRAALRVLVEEKLVENSATMGEYLMKKLQTINSKWIKNIQGKGLFIGVELISKSGGARRFCEELAKRGILCKETHDMVIRFAPPLVINKREIDQAFKIVKEVLEKE